MCACSHSRLCQVQVEGGGASEEKFGSMCSSVLSSYHLLSKTLEEVCVLVCVRARTDLIIPWPMFVAVV